MTNDFLLHINAIREKASKHRNTGNNSEAESLLRSALEEIEAHTPETESQQQALRTLRIAILNDVSWIQGSSEQAEESKQTAEVALALAIKHNDEEQQSRSLHGIAQYYSRNLHFSESMQYFTAALNLSRKVGDQRNTANILSNIGYLYLRCSDMETALDYYSEALPIHEEQDNKRSIAVTCGQIALIYDQLLQHERSLEYNLKAQAIMEELGDMESVGGALNNIGFNYANLGEYEKARESYLRAIELREKFGKKWHVSYPYTNLGDVLRQMGRYEESLERLMSGLAMTRSAGEQLQEGRTLAYLARLYATEEFAGHDTGKAIQCTQEALQVFQDLLTKHESAQAEIVKQHFLLAELYKRTGNFETALHHFSEFHTIEKHVRNEGVLAKSAQFEQKLAYVAERARAQATEDLLHKTLPKTIADRVMKGDTRIADHFESVSILFADIVNFTRLSAHLPPATVLDFMNFIFERFDSIALRHGCERIKTIGDGYMVVCGAPVKDENHAVRIAHMALEMMDDIRLPDEIRRHLPDGTMFHLRIGLHCGEITAGLIGTGKLAYDVYGDAVNTASRMESHGEAGKIHVSEDFVHEVTASTLAINKTSSHDGRKHVTLPKRLDDSHIVGRDLELVSVLFIPREEIDVKGKGLMRTYFLEAA